MKRLIPFLLVLALLTTSIAAQQGMGPGPGLGKPPGGGGGGGGSDFVTDTFTETGSSLVSLASHTGETGATWTLHPDASYSSTFSIDALNTDASPDNIYPNGTAAYYTSGTPPSADYYVQSSLVTVTVLSVNIGACGHMDTTANTMVCWRIANGTAWELRQAVAGTFSTLATNSTNLPSAGSTQIVKLTFASSGTTAAVEVDGVTVISPTSISVTATGRAGVRGSGGVSFSTGFHLDNYSAR